MTTPDWAERVVVKAGYDLSEYGEEYKHVIGADEVIALLKAERRRAVRKCRNMVVKASRDPKEKLIYFEACSDCATAIAGGK